MPRTAPSAVFCVLWCVSSSVSAHADNPHVWRPEPRSVTVFKNGLGFFVREGEVELRDGWCVSGPVPPALFGTFAIYALAEGQTVDIVGAGVGELLEFDRPGAKPDAAAVRTALAAYTGLELELLHGTDGPAQAASGKLASVSEEHAILDSGAGLTAIPLSDVRRARVVDQPLRIHVAGAPANGKVRLGMAYLRKGITWVPEYSLRLLDETQAELNLRATLVNEAEDLRAADVHLVVGAPNFVHAEYLTPLAIGQAIRATAAGLPEQFLTQQLSNAVMTRAGMVGDAQTPELDRSGDPRAVERMLEGLPQLTAAGASDFSVYSKSDLTVRTGERVMLTVFRGSVRYEHLYRWESPQRALQHLLVLQNETGTAWTTGPVIAVSGDRPLSQDTLWYTPAGARCELPVTTAVNVATEATEEELQRNLKAHEPSHNVFLDRVVIAGKLRVRNFEPQPIDLHVQRAVAGKLLEVSHAGTVRHDVEQLELSARRSAAAWRVTVEAGGEIELTYQYERYVESR